MPAAAVIPAPGAYLKVVAVKKLVVDCLGRFLGGRRRRAGVTAGAFSLGSPRPSTDTAGMAPAFTGRRLSNPASFTVNKLECLKQAIWLEYQSME